MLRQAVEEIGARHWKIVAERVPGRNHVQCLQRYLRVLKPGLKKGHWTPEEDERLRQLASHGFTSWIEAAQQIPGRSAKQCRDRWRNHLEASIKHGPWEPEEDVLLLELHAKHGNRWAAIARCIPGRTENAVKIHCKSLLARRDGRGSENSQSETGFDLRDSEEEEEDSQQGTDNDGGQFLQKHLQTDSEDDPEATTDDLSSISPLPSPMGFPQQWMQPWASPTNASGHHPHGHHFGLSASGFNHNQQQSQAGVLRVARLQSFPPPIIPSNLIMRRSSFPSVPPMQQQPHRNTHAMQPMFPSIDTSAPLLADSVSLDHGPSPAQSPTHAKYAASNGHMSMSYRFDIPPVIRPSSEAVGERATSRQVNEE